MLNSEGVRELAYVVKIDAIEPIVGSDNCEAAVVGGWRVMTRKGTFKEGDLAVYFEIDSKVPETEQFAFLEKKHYKIKTQKYTFGGKGNFVSQGLLMSFADFGWSENEYNEGEFLTKILNVTYADTEDNKRKGKSADKYKLMAQRKPNIFKKKWAQWFMRRAWGRKFMFLLFGRKGDKRAQWPEWVKKTDEERIQNMAWILKDKSEWIATEKIDGTSTTFTARRKGKKIEFLVCSRNVVFDKPDKKCYYETNVYTEMAEKYNIEEILTNFLKKNKDVEWVTLQGETYGQGIQKRDYHRPDHCFMGFNFITSTEGRWNSVKAKTMLEPFGIPWVPVIDEHFILPDTVDELLTIATGESVLDSDMREGLVFRSVDGVQSFKAVSNEFLIKYHQ